MQLVFNGPVASHCVGEGGRRESARGDVGSSFGLDLVVALGPALDHGDGGKLGETEFSQIGALRGCPVDLVGDGVVSDFEPAMTLLDSLRTLELVGRCRIEIDPNFSMKGWLIVLHSQQV